MKTIAKKTLIILLLTLIVMSPTSSGVAFADSSKKSDNANSPAINRQQMVEDVYSTVIEQWKDINTVKDMKIEISPSEVINNVDMVVSKAKSFGYPTDTVRWNEDSELVVDVEVEKTGLYTIAFDYYILDKSILPSEGYIKINDEFQFYESRRIIFPNLWGSSDEDKSLDRYGNELLPEPEKQFEWQKTYANDASYLHMKPLKFKFEKGKNQIKLVSTRGDLLLGNITIESSQELQNYKKYSEILDSKNKSDLNELITIEAEDIHLKNDSSIRQFSEREPAMTPYDTEKLLLNMLDGTSWLKGGQAATWEIDIPKSGFYKIGFKYKQEIKYDLPVFRKIEIDGKTPFKEVENYPFQFGDNWQNEVLSNDDGDFYFYLEKGTHTLQMTVNLSTMRELVEDITTTMKEINELTLEIQKLTGNKVDKYRDWSIDEYIPDVEDRLLNWSKRLDKRYEEIKQLNPTVDEIGEIVNLKMAVKQLNTLAEEPNELPNRLSELSQGTSSVSQMLGDLLGRVTESPLSLDKIYVFNDQELPDPNAGFFTRTFESVKRFFLSFGNKEYSATNISEEELNVWVNRPRQFVELMQKMIDEEFTPATGVRVKLSIMPDENKLILANAADKQPDAALGVNHWLPYELAIRGAVQDLRKFDDFEEVFSEFSKGAIIPFAYEDGVYAMPETQDFWVTFYRKDILQSMNLPVPSTWNDVIEILPELQRLGMNYYSPISLYGGFKPFNATTPFIYQFGGELYEADGMSTAIDSEEALDGIKYMTDLFKIYNLPQQVPNFYHHFRYGTMPVGVSNFQSYIQLRTAAPEIANWWGIAAHPGVEKDGEVVRWAPAGGQTAMIFKEAKKQEEAWDFLKWWMSADTQVEFANQLQTTYGPTYMWNTANLTAFAQLPWPAEDKEVILEQFKWVREASRVPGAYMVERELSNSWNKIVFDGDKPRTTIDDAVITIDREIERKMEEFGYWGNGEMLKPYKVPTIENIDDWIESDE
jgi:ABC-type glycerol-3-phosphate transport system substrate-binding protein